jgi:hypothetical protein
LPTDSPIQLLEDAGTGDRFLLYETGHGVRLDIRYQGDTLWMTQEQIARLFGRDRSVVTKHIANIFGEGELDEESCVQKMHSTAGRPPTLYNLDVVISVGYRVSSVHATFFRRWATGILVRFAKAGFVVDAARLKSPDNVDRVAELREIIRDIRSDEANVYRELKRICSLCQDYDGASAKAQTFFRQTQAKLVYAVVSQTPAEIVRSRADHQAPNMGLRTWPNENVRKQDVGVSKNYLAESEIRELNRLTTILLDIFEDQADLGRLILIADAANLLDAQLAGLGRAILHHGGSVAADDAKRHAEAEYRRFETARKLERHLEADKTITELTKAAKGLPRRKG